MNLGSSSSGGFKRGVKQRTFSAVLAAIGYILSPLSWWNDMFVNIPLAYIFAFPFSLMNDGWFLSAFIFGYWLSNLLGFILLHRGFVGLMSKQSTKLTLARHIIVTIIYTGIMVLFVWLHWIPMPNELIQ